MMPRVNQLALVKSISDLSIHCQISNTINTYKLPKGLLLIFTMWFLFVDDLDYTLGVIVQDISYIDRRYWSHLISQSSVHLMHTSHQLLLDQEL